LSAGLINLSASPSSGQLPLTLILDALGTAPDYNLVRGLAHGCTARPDPIAAVQLFSGSSPRCFLRCEAPGTTSGDRWVLASPGGCSILLKRCQCSQALLLNSTPAQLAWREAGFSAQRWLGSPASGPGALTAGIGLTPSVLTLVSPLALLRCFAWPLASSGMPAWSSSEHPSAGPSVLPWQRLSSSDPAPLPVVSGLLAPPGVS
jgi:hypothetical protein